MSRIASAIPYGFRGGAAGVGGGAAMMGARAGICSTSILGSDFLLNNAIGSLHRLIVRFTGRLKDQSKTSDAPRRPLHHTRTHSLLGARRDPPRLPTARAAPSS